VYHPRSYFNTGRGAKYCDQHVCIDCTSASGSVCGKTTNFGVVLLGSLDSGSPRVGSMGKASVRVWGRSPPRSWSLFV